MSERQIDPVSEAIGALKSDVRTVLEAQRSRDNIDADFRREMRTALGSIASVPSTIAQLAAQSAENKTAIHDEGKRVTAVEKRLDRLRNLTSGALIILSGLWAITAIILNKAPDWLRLFHQG